MPNIGAAFSGGLENFMAQQAASKRQAMLDDLAIKRDARQAQSDLDAHNEHLQTMHDHLTKVDEEKHANRVKAVEKWKATKVKGDIPSVEMMAEMKDLGMGDDFQSTPETVPGPTEGGQPLTQPGPAMYLGSTAERLAGAQKATEADMGKALEGVTDRAAASRIALKFGVPYAQVDDVVNAYVGKPAIVPAKPQSVQEFEYNNAQLVAAGQKPLTYQQYQDQDANRKKVVVPTADDAALGLSDAGLDMAAKLYQKTGTLPPMGMGKEGAKVRTRVINRAAQYDGTTDTFHEVTPGGVVPDIAAEKSDYLSDAGAQAQLTKNLHAVKAFAGTAKDNGALFDKLLKDVPDIGVTWINRPFREAATAFGSDTMAQFNVLRQSVQTEYARTINNPNLTGVLSDTARKEIEKGLADGATVSQFKASLKAFAAEAANRESNLEKEIADVKKSIRGGPAKADSKPLTKEDYRKKYNY